MGKPTDIPPTFPDTAYSGLDRADSLPPPYSEHDQTRPQQAPRYDIVSGSSVGGSTSLQSATIRFPPTMNGYFSWKSTTTFHMGPTADEKLFAVSMPTGFFNNKPSIVLYNGPTNKHPILATSRIDKWGRTRPIEIVLHPRPGHPREAETTSQMFPSAPNHHSAAFTFEVATGNKGTECEHFEWRFSHGNEIKQLASGHSSGWKLVRLSGPVHGEGGKRKERDLGVSSDGLEIVALLAHNMSMSMTKGFLFAFMGSGLTGTLGEDWEVTTVVTALQLWFFDVCHATPVGNVAPTDRAAST